MREVAGIGGQAVARCRPHIPERESADIMHAATCLQAKAVLITNDRDFDGIKESGVIEVWSISEAIRKLSIQRFSDAVIRITRRRPAGSLFRCQGALAGGELHEAKKLLAREKDATTGRKKIVL